MPFNKSHIYDLYAYHEMNQYVYLLQSHDEQLDIIANLIEKHKLHGEKNNFLKGPIWNKINRDFAKATGIIKKTQALKSKWTNKMNKLREFDRCIKHARGKTGKQ